ncbi:MAG: ergothioneine biosynthesis protein EgtB [Burkholderiales bacterium]|nr:ergothioneine biosynthesis protein EgtB [Burkholderiales bacterium]
MNPPPSPNADPGVRYSELRKQTERLIAGLSAEDCALQSMPEASPVKWHLAHTTWFFETFVLERYADGYVAPEPAYRYLYNSYYNAVGEQFPRAQRGLISRPSLADVQQYRDHIDTQMKTLIASGRLPAAALALIELGINHEQQHQELILTDIKHLLSLNPLAPAYRDGPWMMNGAAAPLDWTTVEGGVMSIGADSAGFAFDNELPRNKQYVAPFTIANRLVTNGEYLQFVEDGGYRRPELWLAEGWITVTAQGWQAPLYWRQNSGAWQEFTLRGLQSLDPARPMVHVSQFEADAYVRWADARLPTEFEWEVAAASAPARGNFVESGELHPRVQNQEPLAAMFGDVWEWTQSAYAPYPGYRTVEGAVGEYNGKFMSNQYVLRGGSCATPQSHIRATYRNFFPSAARWQFSGIRLARDAT